MALLRVSIEIAQSSSVFVEAGVTVRDPSEIRKDMEHRISEIRRDVEELCTQGGLTDDEVDRRATWSMLHFALDDWKASGA